MADGNKPGNETASDKILEKHLNSHACPAWTETPPRTSMIVFGTGDVLRSNAEALVNTVNCVGIMGRGVALQFKKAFPENFKAYKAPCDKHEVQPGRMFVFETGYVDTPKYIINFPTKRHWKGKSRIEDIESGLRAFVDVIRERKIHSVALPPLGSGLGGLHWPDVRRRIEAAVSALPDVAFTIFETRDAGPADASSSGLCVPARDDAWTRRTHRPDAPLSQWLARSVRDPP
jgi:O-acetyl-ADP-ribose deacetylase (regulator of RNase III)